MTHISLCKAQRLGRAALTALVLGLAGAAFTAMPLDNLAFAGNGNGNGGGKGGGNGGGHGHDGGKGGGNGGGDSSGKGGGQDGNGASGQSDVGKGNSTKSGNSGADDSADKPSDDDGSLSPSKLGKLNGFFHASENGLVNASPNSAHGRISHTLKDALSDYARANEAETDPNAPDNPNPTPAKAPSIDDLGAILAGATNKTVTARQVKAIVERLADLNPDDESLNHFADTVDDGTAQDIADAANQSKSGETAGSDGGADTSGIGTDGSNETTIGEPDATLARTTN